MFSYLKKVLDAVFPSPQDIIGRGEKAIRVNFCATGPEETILPIFRNGMEFPSGNIKLEGSLNLPEILNEWEVDSMYAVPSLKVIFLATATESYTAPYRRRIEGTHGGGKETR